MQLMLNVRSLECVEYSQQNKSKRKFVKIPNETESLNVNP